MPVNIRIITASAGSGKTTRLSQVLDDAIASGAVRPEGIVATTFTKAAAAELIERARARLLVNGRGREAQELLAARIGTVNSICGAFVTEFAFELGLSPELRVLDENAAELEQKRALAGVVSAELSEELTGFRDRFEGQFNWHQEVRKLIEAARANGLDASGLRASAERSIETLNASLGPAEADGAAIDRVLLDAIDRALVTINTAVDTTKTTAEYLQFLRDVQREHRRGRLAWGEWAKLAGSKSPAKKSAAAAGPIEAAAVRHVRHPRLRAELAQLIRLLFDVAADGLAAYEEHKRQNGVIDFVDQEALALRLLRQPDVRAALEGELDLVLIDEFQDTSPLQLAIFVELASLARESVWVGDQKQAIYGFRGTDPALMDAVIESLTATITDPELVRAAVAAVGQRSAVETLSISYRSRPGLVELTNDIFARAFALQGMPEERTRLTPAVTSEPAGLGPFVEHWPLRCPERSNKAELAAAVASGVRDLLGENPTVRARSGGTTRPATAGDVAVLCRTNEQCQLVAESLAELDVPAVVPRMRLLDTAEGQLMMAALRLWVDPRDALAAAELARLVTYAADVDAMVARALAAPGRESFAADPLVTAILAARAAAPDLDPAGTITAIIDAAGLRELCAAWGNTAQRHANLDALRAQAVAYVREASAAREPATLMGLINRFDASVEVWGWYATRTDAQALLRGDAVTVSTWHAAKGREWPLTVLYGLESVRQPVAYGLQVVADSRGFDLTQPLAGRWLRYWPNPYTTANQNGAVRGAMEASPAFSTVVDRNQREALRLLYVGWTRARDRIILAANEGKLTNGLFRTLVQLDPTLISEPPGETAMDREIRWAGRSVTVRCRPARRAEPVPRATFPGESTVARGPTVYPPARLRPSSVPPVPCTLGGPVVLGPRLPLRGNPNMELVGSAVHAFLAADRIEFDEAFRLEMADGLLRRYGVHGILEPGAVVSASTRLSQWLDRVFTPTRLHREWPVAHRQPNGTVVAGTADLVVRSASGIAVIDHKTFPGTLEQALVRIPTYSGQLKAYTNALVSVTPEFRPSSWVHLPVLGVVVELRI